MTRLRSGAALAGALAVLLAPGALASGRGADGQWSERRTHHFLLLQDVDIDRRGGFHGSLRFERQVLEVLEAAHDRLHEYLGLRPERVITVRIWDPALFDANFAGLFRFPAAGFYGGTIHVRGETRVTTYLQRVLHHELVHAAFDQVAPSLVLPAWFNEGVSEWFEARAVGKRRLAHGELAALQRAQAGGALFGLRELSAPSLVGFGPDAAGLAYLQSYGMIEHLVRRHGERELRDFVRETIRTRRLDTAFRRAYRFPMDELPRRFADDL